MLVWLRVARGFRPGGLQITVHSLGRWFIVEFRNQE